MYYSQRAGRSRTSLCGDSEFNRTADVYLTFAAFITFLVVRDFLLRLIPLIPSDYCLLDACPSAPFIID